MITPPKLFQKRFFQFIQYEKKQRIINQNIQKKTSLIISDFMQYNEFFHTSLTIILQAFSDYLPKDHIVTLAKKYEHTIRPDKSIYIEIFAYSNNVRTKIQQWKFKPKGEPTPAHLERSYSRQNSNDSDSELSFSELNEPTFFKTLENIRKSIQPKLLLKKLQRVKVLCEIKDNEQQLISFSNGNTFYFEVAEYENQLFEVKLSLKYNYEDEVVAMEMKEIAVMKESDSDEFELLIDESYENKLRKEAAKLAEPKLREQCKQNATETLIQAPVKEYQRKMSEIVTSSKNLTGKQEMLESQKSIKLKRQLQFQEIDKLFKNIDFTTVQSTKLKTFLEYLL